MRCLEFGLLSLPNAPQQYFEVGITELGPAQQPIQKPSDAAGFRKTLGTPSVQSPAILIARLIRQRTPQLLRKSTLER